MTIRIEPTRLRKAGDRTRTFGRSLPSDPGRGPNDHDKKTGAEQAEPKIARIVLSSLQWAASQIPDSVYRSGDADKIMKAFPWADFSHTIANVTQPLETVIRKSAEVEIAAQKTAAGLTKAERVTPSQTNVAEPPEVLGGTFAMDVVNPLSVQFANTQAGKLVVQISDSMRAMIAQITESAASGTVTAYDMARMLKTVIPLHAAWAAAVTKQFDKNFAAYMKDGQSAAQAQAMAQNLADAYGKKLQTARAWNIARTETSFAANVGKYAGWSQGVSDGYISADSFKRWDEGRDPCAQCEPLVGEIVRWDEPFSNGEQMPPDHPSCRCTGTILPPDEDIRRQYAEQQAANGATTAAQTPPPPALTPGQSDFGAMVDDFMTSGVL